MTQEISSDTLHSQKSGIRNNGLGTNSVVTKLS